LIVNGAAREKPRIPPLVRMAALTGVESTIKAFLQKGGLPDTTDDEGRSILQIAASKGNVSVCRLLMTAGASPTLADHRGLNALDAAAASGSVEVLDLLRGSLGALLGDPADGRQGNGAEVHLMPTVPIQGTVEPSPPNDRTGSPNNVLAMDERGFSSFAGLLEEDPGEGGWEPETEVHFGLGSNPACHSLAESVHGRITHHRTIDRDKDWSDVAVLLPVAHRGKISFSSLGEATTAWVARLLAHGDAFGWVPLRWVVEACTDFGSEKNQEDLKLRLEMLLGEFGIQIVDETGWEELLPDEMDADPADIPIEAISFLGDLNPAERDPLSFYYQILKPLPLLDKDEERICGRLWQNDRNPEGVRRLVEGNLRFVVKEARRFQGLGLDIEDLVSEGNLGLLEAAKKYDPERETRFLTYASWWIRQRIFHALSEQVGKFRVPQKVAGHVVQLNRIIVQLSEKLGREPNLVDLSSEGTFPEKYLERLLAIRQTRTEVISEDGQEASVPEEESVASADPGPAEALAFDELGAQILVALNLLNSKERAIITQHFGLEDGEPGTLDTIGQTLCPPISRERVRQIEERALSKIKSRRERMLKPFIEELRPAWEQSSPVSPLPTEDQDESE